MAKKQAKAQKPEENPSPEPYNAIDEEARPGESLEDWMQRMDGLEDEAYAEWEKADPRNPRKVKRSPQFLADYDPNMGVN